MKLKAIAAALLAAPLVVACGSTEKAETFTLNGAGASFPAPLYTAWFGSFAEETGNQVNYQAVGVVLVSVNSLQRLLTSVPLMVL